MRHHRLPPNYFLPGFRAAPSIPPSKKDRLLASDFKPGLERAFQDLQEPPLACRGLQQAPPPPGECYCLAYTAEKNSMLLPYRHQEEEPNAIALPTQQSRSKCFCLAYRHSEKHQLQMSCPPYREEPSAAALQTPARINQMLSPCRHHTTALGSCLWCRQANSAFLLFFVVSVYRKKNWVFLSGVGKTIACGSSVALHRHQEEEPNAQRRTQFFCLTDTTEKRQMP